MKKLIAMLACLTLALTMFAGLTVSAADYGTPTFKLVPQTEADGSLAVVDGCYVVDVVYEGFENFAALSGSSRKPSATGIMGAEVYWSNDNDTAYVYDGADNGVGKGGLSTEVAVISASDVATIVTGTSGVICSAYYVIEDENAVANLKIDSVVVNVRKYVDGAAVSAEAVDLATADVNLVGCTLAKAAPAPAEFDVTYAANDLVVWGNKPATTTDKVVKFEATPAFGYMITAVNGEAVANTAGGEYEVTLTEATEIAVTVAAIDTKVIATKYVDAENGKTYIFGKANFAATDCGVALTKGGVAVPAYVNGAYKADGKYAATANANGAFGVAFTFNSVNGLFDGISATAYADGESAAAIALN